MNKENTVPVELVDEILENTIIEFDTIFGKTTVVYAKLPNGFVLTESSSSATEENYDLTIGYEICIKRIRDRIFELEGYKLHDKMNQNSNPYSDGGIH